MDTTKLVKELYSTLYPRGRLYHVMKAISIAGAIPLIVGLAMVIYVGLFFHDTSR